MKEGQKEKLKQDLVAHLKQKFPAGVPRSRVAEATGGVISGKTLANLACLSNENLPVGIFKIRGRVVIPHEALAEWLFDLGEYNDET